MIIYPAQLTASSVKQGDLNTLTGTFAGSINAYSTVSIAMNGYAFFPMIHAGNPGVSVGGHGTDVASGFDSPRFLLTNHGQYQQGKDQGPHSTTYDVDYRYLVAA